MKAERSPVPSSLPADSVSLSGASPAKAKALKATGLRTAALTTRAMDLSPGRLTQLATDLLDQGLDLEARGWTLIGQGEFRDADAEEIASKALKGQPDQLRAYHPSLDGWLPLQGASDLYKLHTFYADGDVAYTENPQLASDLRTLSESGFKFWSEHDRMGPMSAFNNLRRGEPVGVSVARSRLKDPDADNGWVEAFPHTGRKRLKNPEEIALVRYLYTGETQPGEQIDPLARSLRYLEQEGISYGANCSFDGYQDLRNSPAPQKLSLSLKLGEKKVDFAWVSREELDDPDKLAQRVSPMLEAVQELDEEAYYYYSRTPETLPGARRIQLARELKSFPKEMRESLLHAISKGADLETELALAREYKSPEDYRQARKLKPEERQRYFTVLQAGVSPEISGELVSKFGSKPGELEAALGLTRELTPMFGEADKAARMVSVSGTQPDRPWLERLSANKLEAPHLLYGLGEGLEESQRSRLLELGQRHGASTLVPVWSAFKPEEPAQLEARSGAWEKLLEAADETSRPRVNQYFLELVESYPEQVVKRADLLRMALEGSGGDISRAGEAFEQLKEVKDLELASRVYARTGDLGVVSAVVELAAADHPELSDLSLEQRAEAVARLARAFEGEELASNYEFLRRRHEKGEDLSARAELLAQAGNQDSGRAAVATYENSPHCGSVEAAESLGQLLTMGHLYEIRDLWERLESAPAEHRDADRQLLGRISERSPDRKGPGLRLFQALQAYPLSDGGRCLEAIPEKFLLGSQQAEFMSQVLESQSTREERTRELEILGRLMEDHSDDKLLQAWPFVRPHRDLTFEDLDGMFNGVHRKGVREALLESRRPDEALAPLSRVAEETTKPESLLDLRLLLEKGSPEGNELVQNTAFLADMLELGISNPKDFMMGVFAPIGDETTEVRRREIRALAEKIGTGEQLIECWKTVTRYCSPGSEKYANWIQKSTELREDLGRKVYEFMDFVGAQQARRPSLTLDKALEVAMPYLVDGSPMNEVKRVILEQESFDIKMDGETVTVGDFTLEVK